MLDHVFFPVPPSQFDSMVAWYLAALAPLGYVKQLDNPGQAVGFGPGKGDAPFWITAKEDAKGSGIHLAFRAKDHETVDRFYEEAIKAGGTCDGKPGLRTRYHPNYYVAYVLDPMG
jgi:hypothetical protein